MITVGSVQILLDAIVGGLAQEIADEFNEREFHARNANIDDVIRYVLRTTGESIDQAAFIAYLKEREPDLVIETVGRNVKDGYLWARIVDWKRSKAMIIPDIYFRYVDDPNGIYFVPGSDVRPPEKIVETVA